MLPGQGGLCCRLRGVQQPPVDEGVVHKGLKHGSHALLVLAQHTHHVLAGGAEVALYAAHLHGLDHHAGQAERDLLGELLAVHGRLKAVPKVNVQQLATIPVEHEVGGVPVPQAQDVAHHGHDCSGARVVGAPVQPHLTVAALEPQHLVQVLPARGLECVLKHLHLLDDCEVVVVGGHAQHQAVLHVESHLAGVPVLADECVQGVAVGHPADEAAVGAEGDDGVACNREVALRGSPVVGEHSVDKAKQLHHALVLPQVLVTLEQEHVLGAITAMNGQLAGPLLGADDVELGSEGGYGDQRLAGDVGAWHRKLHALRPHQCRGHILQLQGGHAVQLLVDALEDMVVQVPGLVQLCLLAAGLVLHQPLKRLVQLPAICLGEGNLLEGGGPVLLHHVVQGQQRVEHALHIALTKVQPGRLLQALVPHLVPQDGHADELVADQLGLLHKGRAVLPDLV
mmetsp:Transcript_13522/g.28909  ORF Transcript_13522/g.28909 Transcript_13522/m.28909 type:complete len:454 (-) Transcript_13522:2570-3931(-)